jgi:hypothetical protein
MSGLLIAVLVLQGVQIVVTALALRALAGARAARSEPATTELVRGLETPINRLATELQHEHQRLTELVRRAEAMIDHLSTAGLTERESASEVAERAVARAREEARRRLLAGESPESVADQVDLPLGEIRVLANVLDAKAKEGSAGGR